ncbi:hypothetical protein CS0771_49340 [Catellatospora sp. IY07-71]|uniref:hypothetical protein n=1 Tax=Catellatospora sp. IY07-71 TaxID=2728827 RepID=UPI001BB3F40C|nr:hypothetical protein [Catellatospora sp. IY07-71]BCJ75390.1 hypothetical protein CS0771_49340 [Catellatospora sp. IY07-71]
MPVQPRDTALDDALRLDFAGPLPAPPDDLGAWVLDALAATPEPLSACVVVHRFGDLPAGTYCLDSAGCLHRLQPPLAHVDADVAVLLGGPATASPGAYRRLGIAAGVVSRHLAVRLGPRFVRVAYDDETTAWPLTTVNSSLTHLTTVTGKEAR